MCLNVSRLSPSGYNFLYSIWSALYGQVFIISWRRTKPWRKTYYLGTYSFDFEEDSEGKVRLKVKYHIFFNLWQYLVPCDKQYLGSVKCCISYWMPAVLKALYHNLDVQLITGNLYFLLHEFIKHCKPLTRRGDPIGISKIPFLSLVYIMKPNWVCQPNCLSPKFGLGDNEILNEWLRTNYYTFICQLHGILTGVILVKNSKFIPWKLFDERRESFRNHLRRGMIRERK